MTSTCSVCARVFEWKWSGKPVCSRCRAVAANRVTESVRLVRQSPHDTTVCFGCGSVFSCAVPVGSVCEACSSREEAYAEISGLVARLEELGEESAADLPLTQRCGCGRFFDRSEPGEWCGMCRRADESCLPCALPRFVDDEVGEELDAVAEESLQAARTLLPVHSEEQLARIGEFGCSSLSVIDRPCGSCADCTPEDDLIPPLFAVADLPGFDDVAARRLAEIEIALDEGVREPAAKPAPKPWCLPVMVSLYPIALIVALTTEASPWLCRVTGCGCRGLRGVVRRVDWVRAVQLLVATLAVCVALVVLGYVAWAVGTFLAWVWSYIGWWTIPALIVGACLSDR